MSTVYVSGATGFIAQHIVVLLINQGYKVIGSVRSQSKGEHLSKLINSKDFGYEIVEDIEKEGAFDKSLQNHPEIEFFLHTASPFHFKATNVLTELLNPAVSGTINALKAIEKYGVNIKRVVVTSSYAAVSTVSKETDPNHTYTEESWNEVTWEDAQKDPVAGYRASKKFAELAAWEFLKTHKDVKFDINYILPSYVFGPQAFDSEVKDDLNTSSEVLNSFLKLTPESEIPLTKGGYVDVRDVAKAHLVAIEDLNLKNERIILNSGRFTSYGIIKILNRNFKALQDKLPKIKIDKDDEYLSQFATIDNSKSKKELGFKLIELEQTVVDSISQILNAKK